MRRATAEALNASLEMAHTLVKSGVLFVPVPAANEQEYTQLLLRSNKTLPAMLEQAAQEEKGEKP